MRVSLAPRFEHNCACGCAHDRSLHQRFVGVPEVLIVVLFVFCGEVGVLVDGVLVLAVGETRS